MTEPTADRIRPYGEVAALVLYAGFVLAAVAEMVATLVVLRTLGTGTPPPWNGFVPSGVPDVGPIGRLLAWTAVAVAGFALVDRTTGADFLGSAGDRRRAFWSLLGATFLGVLGALLAVLWLLGLLS